MPDNFLIELDGMIESTEEFILDDDLLNSREKLDKADTEGRLADLVALNHVRKLYTDVFRIGG